MTTILESPPQVTVIPEQVQKQTVPSPTPTAPPKKRRFTAAIVIAVVALVAALTAVALSLGTTTSAPDTSTTAAAANTTVFAAYGPGSTVYDEQVPALAPALSYYEGAFGHGSVTYAEQVPTVTTVPPNLPAGSPSSEWPPAVTAPAPTAAPHGAAPFE